MMWQTVRSAISRAEGDLSDAHEDIKKAIADIQRGIERLADAQRDMQCAGIELGVLKKLGDKHGEEHEVPYPYVPVEVVRYDKGR
jgi:hypothetical protein